uniref:Uncharacterized protein n=1 Tax=Tetranychus urticae TaxID=32264 RepID=T1L442_TETUR
MINRKENLLFIRKYPTYSEMLNN